MSGVIGATGSKSGVIGTTELEYEEGTFTPLEGSGGYFTGTITELKGKYIRIGNWVTVYYQLYAATTKMYFSSERGYKYITNGPFIVDTNGGGTGTFNIYSGSFTADSVSHGNAGHVYCSGSPNAIYLHCAGGNPYTNGVTQIFATATYKIAT